MVNRLLNISKSRSFFIFGARGVGKSTFLKSWSKRVSHTYLNLLDPIVEDDLRLHPENLTQIVKSKKSEWIIIDEVQKLPRLLDLVHLHIVEEKQKFALSGSSARKLKRGQANLLAGRASVYQMYPFSSFEIGSNFELQQALEWGTLPEISHLENDTEKANFLKSYCLTYLKEEIASEQIVRKLDPFRSFLPIAAQMSGKVINFSKIAREVGVDTVTVQNYFQILEDTLLGFFLPAYHQSVRKRQLKAPKFYLFDTGVTRSLANLTDVLLKPQTSLYGVYFENFLVNEIMRLSSYYQKDWSMSYLQTDHGEVDLILEKPGHKTVLIEIKSTTNVSEQDAASLNRFVAGYKNAQALVLSQDKLSKQFDNVTCLHWQVGLAELGFSLSK